MPLVGEEENGVHEWGTQSHTCKHGLHNIYESRAQLMVFLFLLQVM